MELDYWTWARKRVVRLLADLADESGMRASDVIKCPELLEQVGLKQAHVSPSMAREADGYNKQRVQELLDKYDANKKVEKWVPPDLIEEEKRIARQKRGVTENDHKKLFGHFVTAVIRWMGKEGWTFNEAREALDELNWAEVADATINIQLKAGKTGKCGEPAQLDSKQIRTLNLARG